MVPLVRELLKYCEIVKVVLWIWQIVGYSGLTYRNLADCNLFPPHLLHELTSSRLNQTVYPLRKSALNNQTGAKFYSNVMVVFLFLSNHHFKYITLTMV